MKQIKEKVKKWQEVIVTTSCVTGLTLIASMAGWLEPWELKAFDRFTRLRPAEPLDDRIVIVTIDEEDLENYGFPISDRILAQTINKIQQQQPRVISIDLYRNLPQEPGHQELVEVFASTENIIGVEKAIGESVEPPHTLPPEQVALADLVIDADNKVRRALLSIQNDDGSIQLGLGTLTALNYLADDNIFLEAVESPDSDNYQLGKATIRPFAENDGGYVNADMGGYQILLNYRGLEYKFHNYSLTEVLENKTPPDWAKERMIFIGSISESINDRFLTPFSSSSSKFPRSTPGVIIHANIASQLVSAALDTRKLTRVIDQYWEWMWILCWSLIGSVISWLFLEQKFMINDILLWTSLLTVTIVLPGIGLLTISYLIFLHGWWTPVVAPFVALSLSALTIPNYRNYTISQRASLDSLTQVPNRGYFDTVYPKLWQECQKRGKPISAILCDVDYFKLYNDNYGHPAGDKCLHQVAQAIRKAIRTTDMVARYGGEEFIIIFPDTEQEIALKIGERICEHIRNLNIVHQHSLVSDVITISGGLATMRPDHHYTPEQLIAQADYYLYMAKDKGRNLIMTYHDRSDQGLLKKS